MKAEYDFSKAKRAKDVPHLAKLQATASKGKTRVTIYLDDSILESFRLRAEAEGRGYQTLINEALKQVPANSNPVTEDVVRRIIREELHPACMTNAIEPVQQLGPREREVLRLLAEGGTLPEIAKRLDIAPRTVEIHRRNIMQKLGLHDIASLTKYAVRNELTYI